jgi:uncharacterized membrane protein YraQ (UPF0718 family)
MINIFNGSGLVPVLTGLGFVWFMILAIKARNSGSVQQDLQRGPQYSNKKTWSVGHLVFAGICLAATIAYFIIQYYEK